VIDDVEGKSEDVSYLNAKAIIVEGKAEVRDDNNGSFAKKMYERYTGKDSLSNAMVQYSVNHHDMCLLQNQESLYHGILARL
jgi:hypothetical protein